MKVLRVTMPNGEGPAIDPKVFREQCNLLTFNWCRFSD